MPALRLPADVEAVFHLFRTCKFTTVNRQEQALTWPTEPFYHQAAGQLISTASIAFPVKAYNARRHPQVALLLSDPTGLGWQDTDRMPVAGNPIEMIQFMLLGCRKAREYLAKRGAPWPPRPWDKTIRYLEEQP